MKNISVILFSLTTILSLIASCGKKEDSKQAGAGNQAEIAIDPNGLTQDSMFMASFSTLNSQTVGTIPGSATIKRKDSKIYAYIRLFAGAPRAWHQQNIFMANRCPTMSDDTNEDGFLDINEAYAVLGKILIPLDADISTQSSGRNFFPLGDLSGSYHYERITNFERFLSDLKSEDKDPADNLVKLKPDENLIIEGKAVMIQGVADTIEFPDTVTSTARHQVFQTLPIACGIFRKINFIPGTDYNGQIPGPIAEVEEGQDRPAPEEAPAPTTGNTPVPGTTGTNETTPGETPTTDEHGRTRTGDPDSNTNGSTTGSTPERERDSQPPRTTTGGNSTGGSTTGDSDTTGSSTGNSTTGGETSGSGGESTTGGVIGGIIGGFIGGSEGI